jgi:hypothetical protein
MKALIRVSSLVFVCLLVSLALGAAGGGKAVVWPAGDI